MSGEESDSCALRYVGFCNLALYILLAVFFWTAWSFKANRIDQVLIATTTVALAVLYFTGLKYVGRAKTSTVVVFAVCLATLGFLTPPFDSTDVFFYMASGWNQAHYGSNPYSQPLRDTASVANDPMIKNDWMARNRNPWLDIPLPYGFLFALVARAIAWLGRGNLWTTLALFSFLNLVIHAGTALLLWKAGRFLPEGNGKTILYLYTWNPFVVLQYLADLHNDILVGFLVVLAAYLILKGRPIISLPLLVAAGLIKYVTLTLVPFALIFLVRRKGWRQGVLAILLSATVIVVTAIPYMSEISSFKFGLIFDQLSESSGSLHAFIVYSFRALGRIWPALVGPAPAFATVTKIGLWLLFAAFLIREMYISWQERSEQPLGMIQRWTSILFALIFVASSQFYAWYIGMMFPLALLTHRKTILTDAVIALSGAHILSFTFLRRKAIGYFVFATLVPLFYLVISHKKAQKRTTDFVPFCG